MRFLIQARRPTFIWLKSFSKIWKAKTDNIYDTSNITYSGSSGPSRTSKVVSTFSQLNIMCVISFSLSLKKRMVFTITNWQLTLEAIWRQLLDICEFYVWFIPHKIDIWLYISCHILGKRLSLNKNTETHIVAKGSGNAELLLLIETVTKLIYNYCSRVTHVFGRGYYNVSLSQHLLWFVDLKFYHCNVLKLIYFRWDNLTWSKNRYYYLRHPTD